LDYNRIREILRVGLNVNAAYRGKEATAIGWPRSIDDINESWIDVPTETFMGALLQRPLVYPERTLTRGEVAKMICNYLGVVPMQNKSTFPDVPTSHEYARYIWAANKIGIMGGDSSGIFRPNDTLSMQEFAVIASRIVSFGKSKLVTDYNNSKDKYDPLEKIDGVHTYHEMHESDLARLEPYAGSMPKVFADKDKIASWAKPAIDEFSRFGILQGDNNGRLNPTEPLDKTRFLVFMAKFEDRLGLFAYGDGGISWMGDHRPLF
jgi:hypothetical protein